MRVERIGDATLYLGDCMEILPTLGKVDAVITDPPFNVGKDYGVHKDDMPEAEYAAWMGAVLTHCIVAAKQVWCVIPTARIELFWNLLPGASQVVIPMTAGYAIRSGWTQKFASLLVHGRPPGNPWNLWEGIRHRGEGYFFKEETYGHPGYTPMGIMQRAVDTSEADSILDPFMGTGTSGVAAVAVRRAFTGIELNPKYFDIACRRIEQAYKQRPLFEAEPAPQPVQMGFIA
jgi:site-specific DNA-methyltransferase (adenine-specific)/modification methylase